jgi:hypothetical protein
VSSQPPSGSKITIAREGADEVLRVPQPRKGVMPYFVSAFLVFWLGGWVMGFKSATSQLMTKPDNMFLVFWLAGWTVGGAFALYFLYLNLRPTVAESLTFHSGGVDYDSGVAPFQMSFTYTNQKDMWKSLFQKRMRKEFSASDLHTLKLRETESGNRLTIDKDSERIDLAKSASEIEREWLYGYLSTRYS